LTPKVNLLPLNEYLLARPIDSKPAVSFKDEYDQLMTDLGRDFPMSTGSFDQQLSYFLSLNGVSESAVEKQHEWFSQLNEKMQSRAPDTLLYLIKGGYNYAGWAGNALLILVHIYCDGKTFYIYLDKNIKSNIF